MSARMKCSTKHILEQLAAGVGTGAGPADVLIVTGCSIFTGASVTVWSVVVVAGDGVADAGAHTSPSLSATSVDPAKASNSSSPSTSVPSSSRTILVTANPSFSDAATHSKKFFCNS